MAFDNRILSGVGVLSAVVDTGSFVGAAKVLGLTQPGVSRAIARLESRVGIRLLDRTTRSVSLTEEGLSFYREITPLLSGIDEVVSQVSGSAQAVRGRLRVNIDPFLSHLLIAPKISIFLERYPELQLELNTSGRPADLISEGYDVAIRFGEPSSSSFVVRKILETQIVTVATPAYLKRFGKPKHPEDLKKHACLQFKNPHTGRPYEWEFRQGRKVIEVETKGPLLVTEPDTLLEACFSGAGIIQAIALGVDPLIEQGQLVNLFPDWPDEKFPLYALYPSKHLPPAKLRVFVDFVMEIAPQKDLVKHRRKKV